MRKILIASSFSLFAAAAALIATHAAAQSPPAARAQADRALPRMAPPGRGGADRQAGRAGRCENLYALAAGRLAYLEARLDLTGAQAPAFARWRDARLAAAKRRAADCAAMPGAQAATPPSPVDRMARQEERLQRRLADIRAERPALEALYAGLGAEQRQILARESRAGRPGMRGRMGFGGGNRMFRRGPMGDGAMRGPMGRGPMGRGPGMMPPDGQNPPPPPPQ